jgi:hypothetical protein
MEIMCNFYYVSFRRMCEYLLIKDTTLIPNILWFEYSTARLETRSRARKIGVGKKGN